MPRKIFDLDISEISLCKSPANKKKFFIKKSQEETMKEFIEVLKKFVAEEDEDAEKALTKEQVAKAEKVGDKEAKALKEALDIVGQYEDIPDDLEGAIMILVKQASFDYPEIEEEINKAGAKLSKTTQAQIKSALDHIKDGPKAIEILKTLLGEKVEDTKKADDNKEENLSAETLAKLEEYEELKKAKEKEDAKEAEQKQQEKIVEAVNKALKDAGLDEIPKKKSIEDQDADEGDKKDKKKGADDDEDLFPSIPDFVIGD